MFSVLIYCNKTLTKATCRGKFLTYTPTALFTLKEVKTGTETGKELGDRSSTHNGQVYPHQSLIGLPTVRSHEGIFLIDY